MLQVAGAEESTVKGDKETSEERVVISSQECLMSSSDDGSEGLEKFLRDKVGSFGGEGLDKMVEVDPAVVLELLDDNLVDRGSTGKNVVAVDKEMSRSRVDDVLRLELLGKSIVGLGKRPLCHMDVGAAYERPSKSVAFQLDKMSGRLSSGECGLVGVSDAGQSFPSSSRPDDTDYGTSELELIARRRVGDLSGGGFVNLQNQIFHVFMEVQCSLVWVLGVQNITPASLQEPC